MLPIVLVGQLFLNSNLNEYVVIVKSYKGVIQYKGNGISGNLDVEMFLDNYLPVDPQDLEPEEINYFQQILQDMNIVANLAPGYIREESNEE